MVTTYSNQITAEDLTPDFLDKEEEALYSEFMLGQEAITFLNSDLGRLLRGMALQDEFEAATALLKVNPKDETAITKLQFKAKVAQQFTTYIQEVLGRGEVAEQSLREYRHN